MSAIVLNIKAVRLKKHFTQEYVAFALGISQNAYSKLELGYTKITIDHVLRIAEVLEVPAIELIIIRI